MIIINKFKLLTKRIMCIWMCVLVRVYVHHMHVAAHGSQRTEDLCSWSSRW